MQLDQERVWKGTRGRIGCAKGKHVSRPHANQLPIVLHNSYDRRWGVASEKDTDVILFNCMRVVRVVNGWVLEGRGDKR